LARGKSLVPSETWDRMLGGRSEGLVMVAPAVGGWALSRKS
jgi:hypothetical protein